MNVLFLADEGFDYSSNQVTEGFHLLQKIGIVDNFWCTKKVVHHGARINDLRLISEEEARKKVDDANLILISSAGNNRFLNNIGGEIIASGKYVDKLVFLDGSDTNQYLIHPSYFRLYLKRELRYPEVENLAWKNVRSLQFGLYDFHLDIIPKPRYDQRDIDVIFLAFGGSSPMRRDCASELDKLRAETNLNILCQVKSDGQPIPSYEEYGKLMQRAKVGISIPGAGVDTLRYWETVGYGALLCTVGIDRFLHTRYAFEPNRHCLNFHNWDAMHRHIKLIVGDEKAWKKITRSATLHSYRHHTTKSRCSQILDMFSELGD